METKICSKCYTSKSIHKFCKDKSQKSGLSSQCKDCRKQYNDKNKERRQKHYQENKEFISLKNKEYREKNKEKLNRYYKKHRKKRNEQSIQWANNNKEYKSEQHKKWREKNKNRHNTNYIEWKKKNREYLKTYRKKRRQNNTNVKLIDNVRRRINIAFKNKTKHSIEYLGIDIALYKEYLENLFQQGMNWNNYGTKGWHIDHIIPLSSAKTEEELIQLFHYTNTQPLWAKDNLIKSARLDMA
jgi:hypothetical protein